MTALKTYFTNGAETTLSSTLSAGATTVNVTSSSPFPSVPFYVVIDPDVDASREVILVDSSKTATTFVLSAASKRGQDGTSDIEHSAGAKVAFVPVGAHFTDMHDRIDAAVGYGPGGTDVAVADGGTGASTAADARTNLGLVIGTDVQAYSAVLQNTTASFTVADETKLDGIEALADVTDATNVAAAGAVMESDTTTAAMGFVVDEDDMASDSATKVPTQQSVKAYVDSATGSGTTVVVKTADESVSSTTSLQNDNELVAAVAANEAVAFRLILFVNGAASDDAKIAFTVPAGASLAWTVNPISNSGGSVGGFVSGSTPVTTSGGSLSIPTGGAPYSYFIAGSVRNGATAGNLQLQWAQHVSGGTSLTVQAGSTLTVERVA